MSLELRDKLSETITSQVSMPVLQNGYSGKQEEAVLALLALGYTRAVAEKSLAKVLAQEPDIELDVLIKRCLQSF